MNNNEISCLENVDKIKLLEIEKKKLQKGIIEIDNEIKLINKSSKHKWKQEREMCLYGERYYCCENCGIIQ